MQDIPRIEFEVAANGCPIRNLPTGKQPAPVMALDHPSFVGPLIFVADPKAIDEIMDNPKVFASGGPQAVRFNSDFSPEVAAVFATKGFKLLPILSWSNGDEHSRYRRLLDKAFLPARVAPKRAYMRELAEQLIAEFPTGVFDFQKHFALRLPVMVIQREFGLGNEHFQLVRTASDAITLMVDFTQPPESVLAGAGHIVALMEVLSQCMQRVRKSPELHVLSDLVHAKVEGDRALSDDEIMSLSIGFLAAGSHTAAAMLGWCMYVLAQDPALQQTLRTDPSRVPNFVEEVLRRHNPIISAYRVAAQDTTIQGKEIKKGSNIVLRLDCANMDPTRWADPERVEIDRPGLRRHYAFGRGRHTCIGNGLARAEIVVGVTAMLEHFASIELGAEKLELIDAFDWHGPRALPLRLGKSAAPAVS